MYVPIQKEMKYWYLSYSYKNTTKIECDRPNSQSFSSPHSSPIGLFLPAKYKATKSKWWYMPEISRRVLAYIFLNTDSVLRETQTLKKLMYEFGF